VGSGNLAFSAVWDRPGDLDILVRTPSNEIIYYANVAADGGFLDADDQVGTGPENIFWDATITPPSGTYEVCVNSWSTNFNPPISTTDPVNVTVTIRVAGVTTSIHPSIMTVAYNTTYDGMCDPGLPTHVTSFAYP
jgi:uncharacterized protein YfaP (DUF2135 family)